MNRIVEPELLDELPATDPRAIRSRRDLKRVNFWMGNAGIIARKMKSVFREPPKRIVEIGSGDGTLLLKIAKKLPHFQPVEAFLVDKQNVVSDETLNAFKCLNWNAQNVKCDLFEWIGKNQKCDCMMANLFLHHFQRDQLSALFKAISAQTEVFIACEPKRTRFARLARLMVGLTGANDVTRNDAEISVRAGFRDQELSFLWPSDGFWEIEERSAGLFSQLFVTKKKRR